MIYDNIWYYMTILRKMIWHMGMSWYVIWINKYRGYYNEDILYYKGIKMDKYGYYTNQMMA